MAQFRSTADLVDLVLDRSGELTDGTSAYEAAALTYLNRIHQSVIAGGSEFNLLIDKPFTWSRSRRPIILELQPEFTTGTVSLTNGSEVGAFSAAVTPSMAGRYLKPINKDDYFRIISHTAGATAFELDAAFPGDTDTALTYRALKLEYDVLDSYIAIDGQNSKLDFQEVAGTELTATLTAGTYTPSALATEAKTQLDSAGADTYTVTYAADTRLFTFVSALGGPGAFIPAPTGTNEHRSAWLTFGFDMANPATAATHVSTYQLSATARVMEPIKVYKNVLSDNYGYIPGVSDADFLLKHPLTAIVEGVPTAFSVFSRDYDGRQTVRFNRFPNDALRIEIDHVPYPKDLKDNSSSKPLIPREWSDILVFGAAADVLFDKEDFEKSDKFITRAGLRLEAMQQQNRKDLARTNPNYGAVHARPEQLNSRRRILTFGTY